MPWWLGEAPEWVIERVNQIEPIMLEHATAVAKEYFESHIDDRDKLARGPAFESMFDVFLNRYAEVDIENFWAPEYSHNVLAHLQIKYDRDGDGGLQPSSAVVVRFSTDSVTRWIGTDHTVQRLGSGRKCRCQLWGFAAVCLSVLSTFDLTPGKTTAVRLGPLERALLIQFAK